MATVVEVPATAPEARVRHSDSDSRQGFGLRTLFAFILVGSAPLLFWHIAGLLGRPHYQFIVFLPIGVWILIREAKSRPLVAWGGVASGLFVILLAAAVIVTGLASYVWSPWIATVGVSAATIALAAWYFGRRGLSCWLPTWIFCNLIVPPPFGLDEDLIVSLRTITTRMTSSVLDNLGILHLTYANIIELPGKPLFIADACSGIHSLYVLMAAALFLGLFCRRSPIHIVLLLVSTFGLVLFENVLRLVVVAAGLRWRMDLSEGTDHFVLGGILFVLSILLVLTTDQLLLFLLPERPLRPASRLFQWFGLRSRDGDGPETDSVFEAPRLGRQVITALCCLFPLLGIFQLTRMPARTPDLSGFMGADIDLPEFGLEGLPAELVGFQREAYETIERVPGDPFGQASQQWTFRRGDTHALISLDYPYNGIHDSSECYTQIGWTLRDEEVLSPEQIDEPVKAEVGRARMYRNLEGNALLLFSMADMHGQQTALIKELAHGDAEDRAGDRFASFSRNTAEQAADQAGIKPPCIQFQLVGRSSTELDETREQALMDLFLAARQHLYHQCLNQSDE